MKYSNLLLVAVLALVLYGGWTWLKPQPHQCDCSTTPVTISLRADFNPQLADAFKSAEK